MGVEYFKGRFNTFFRDDLYGRYKDKANTILSRGAWNDEYVRYPKVLSFCAAYSFKKQWAGYSDSLGHKRTLQALKLFLNSSNYTKPYTEENLAITLGNTATIGAVFKTLRTQISSMNVVTLTPYYPPLIKTIEEYSNKIEFVSSLSAEEVVLDTLKSEINTGSNVLFVSNFIGVEGRIFSSSFWSTLVEFADKKKTYVVIDEGVWFGLLPYPSQIYTSDFVIRISTLSKKYGIPGCKIGFMTANAQFMSAYYESASTTYGGPSSIFFLMGEFLYLFEYIDTNTIQPEVGLRECSLHYDIPIGKLVSLFDEYRRTMRFNKRRFAQNYKIMQAWLKDNKDIIAEAYDFGGINIFLKFRMPISGYNFFLKLISKRKTSVFPGVCLGDESDSLVRITLLEPTQAFIHGLAQISTELHSIGKEIPQLATSAVTLT